MKLNAALFLLAVALSGNALAGDPSGECLEQLKSDNELQILKGKIALGSIDDQTLEILSNDDVPTKNEKEAISKRVMKRQGCKKLGAEWRSKNYPPTLIQIVDGYYSDFTSLAADLYAKKISYGDFAFAKERAKIEQEFENNMADEEQQIQDQKQAEKQQQESDIESLDAATIRQKRWFHHNAYPDNFLLRCHGPCYKGNNSQ